MPESGRLDSCAASTDSIQKPPVRNRSAFAVLKPECLARNPMVWHLRLSTQIWDNTMANYPIPRYIEGWTSSPFAALDIEPWLVVQQAEQLIREALGKVDSGYRIEGGFAIHPTATIETGVVLKGAGIIGPRCFIAAGSYLRGGTYLDEDCIIGPGTELKTSFMFSGAKLAHLNFVGDSIIGSGANIEAGAIIANYRNELSDKTIRIACAGSVIDTGVTKFGSLIGDNTRIGANAVVAPGALIEPSSKVGRLQLIDQYPY